MHAQTTSRSSTAAAVRPFIAFAVLALALYSLLAHWEQRGTGQIMFSDPEAGDAQTVFEIDVVKGSSHAANPNPGITQGEELTTKPYSPTDYPRRVVAHFMLGNTYPYKETDWETTLTMAHGAGLDGLVLNLGPEDWQLEQATHAYKIATRRFWEAQRHPNPRPVQLFLSLDMNVLPSVTAEDAQKLADKIEPLLHSPAYMRRGDKPILSTFSGEHAFGVHGWKFFLDYLNGKLTKKPNGQPVFFWPTFFTSPERFIKNPVADGMFAWNSAWPTHDNTITMEPDMEYLKSGKPFMASVSPLFFTHYGKTGPWAFNKNWIYRSDDLLYPNRWAQIISQPKEQSPEMVQVISWNDYGESHNIAPVSGAEPGSTAWTQRMDHIAFREMTTYFAHRWRDNAPEVTDNLITLWMWYRPHPKAFPVPQDPIGQPDHSEWDLINIMVLVPHGMEHPVLEVFNGHNNKVHRTFKLYPGHANGVKVHFVPGQVQFLVRSNKGTHARGRGIPISSRSETFHYNFNMWSRAWHINPNHVSGPVHGSSSDSSDKGTSHGRPLSHEPASNDHKDKEQVVPVHSPAGESGTKAPPHPEAPTHTNEQDDAFEEYQKSQSQGGSQGSHGAGDSGSKPYEATHKVPQEQTPAAGQDDAWEEYQKSQGGAGVL